MLLHAAVLTAVVEWPGHATIEKRFHEIKITIVPDSKPTPVKASAR